ncbi:hypothetical protein RFI_02095 [Reticulomyxa filosa]|uniref:PH domain-containing protein n=1 Tax=Reticulomyxa filosa TaxID=46433 RepID=X6PAA1_RETFI|nr:hypothetical protein RFI_02095 [Reticulomyxa filosa]|eukprot:ETO34984.1 hypothetical protein RFI_02095 [Reticulomyxa filosa]
MDEGNDTALRYRNSSELYSQPQPQPQPQPQLQSRPPRKRPPPPQRVDTSSQDISNGNTNNVNENEVEMDDEQAIHEPNRKGSTIVSQAEIIEPINHSNPDAILKLPPELAAETDSDESNDDPSKNASIFEASKALVKRLSNRNSNNIDTSKKHGYIKVKKKNLSADLSTTTHRTEKSPVLGTLNFFLKKKIYIYIFKWVIDVFIDERMTSLHPYVMRGPYKDNTKNWYCEFKFCEKTKHLKPECQSIGYWMSSKYESDFILCDDCVKKYSRSHVPNDDDNGISFARAMAKNEKMKEGYMTKQGGSIKTWRRRYFVLFSDGQMYYFKQKENQEIAKGSVDLSTTHRLVKLSLNHEFHVSTRERTWCFRTDDELEKNDWLDAITKLTKIKRKTLTNSNDSKEKNIAPLASVTTLCTEQNLATAKPSRIKQFHKLDVATKLVKPNEKQNNTTPRNIKHSKKPRRTISEQLNGLSQEKLM